MSLYKFKEKPMRTCKLRTAGLASVKSATFGMVRNSGKRAHQGVDLASDNGYRVYAVDDGEITAITRNPSGYGLAITLKINGQNLWVFYAHLSDVKVSVGDKVKAGVCIGLTGSTGNAKGMVDVARGAHLHFEVRTQASVGLGLGGRVDPLAYFELD
jgi:murein DD-endopeptidase MepM/ murein hydrolase activator NlpD